MSRDPGAWAEPQRNLGQLEARGRTFPPSAGRATASPRMSDVGCTAEELMVCTILSRWRELDFESSVPASEGVCACS